MPQQVGERIKDLRIDKGLTLKELGEAIEFNYSNLSKIERGQRKPTIEILDSLATYFNIDIAYFFGENELLTKKQQYLDYDWLALSEEMKQKNITLDELREVAEELAKSKKLSSRFS